MRLVRMHSTRRTRRFGNEVRGHVSEERLRTRRRKVRIVAHIAGSICGVVAMMVLAWGSHQPRFQVAKLVVEGNGAVSAMAVSTYAETVIRDGRFHIFSPSNIFLFPRRRMEEAILKEFPRVLHAEASIRSFKDREVLIRIGEREPFARWCGTGGCYLLDERGFLFAHEDGSAVSHDEVFEKGIVHEEQELVGRYFLPSRFADVSETIRLLEREGMNVLRVSVENEHDFHIALQGGMMLYARFLDDPAISVENLKVALQSDELVGKAEDLSYIDLRFKNRVYYKFR